MSLRFQLMLSYLKNSNFKITEAQLHEQRLKTKQNKNYRLYVLHYTMYTIDCLTPYN